MAEKRNPTEKSQDVNNPSTVIRDDGLFDAGDNSFSCIVKRASENAGGFKDVAGMNELKQKLYDDVLFPLTDEIFKQKYNC